MFNTRIKEFKRGDEWYPEITKMVLYGRKGHRTLEIAHNLGRADLYTEIKVADNITFKDITIIKAEAGWSDYGEYYRDYAKIIIKCGSEEIHIDPNVSVMYEKSKYKIFNEDDFYKLAYTYDYIKEQLKIDDYDDEDTRDFILKNHRILKMLEDKDGDTVKLLATIDDQNKKLELELKEKEVLKNKVDDLNKDLIKEKEETAKLKSKLVEMENKVNVLESQRNDLKRNMIDSIRETLNKF